MLCARTAHVDARAARPAPPELLTIQTPAESTFRKPLSRLRYIHPRPATLFHWARRLVLGHGRRGTRSQTAVHSPGLTKPGTREIRFQIALSHRSTWITRSVALAEKMVG